jgi:hypothetical protein
MVEETYDLSQKVTGIIGISIKRKKNYPSPPPSPLGGEGKGEGAEDANGRTKE